MSFTAVLCPTTLTTVLLPPQVGELDPMAPGAELAGGGGGGGLEEAGGGGDDAEPADSMLYVDASASNS